MYELVIKHVIAFIYLLTGSVSDMRTREVADWSNYGLIALGIVSNLIFSIIGGDYSYIIESLFGLGIFFLLALALFYLGQWGGGDSKLLMGLGALYGIALPLNQSFLIAFLVNTLLAGAFFGIVWSVILAIKNWKMFVRAYHKYNIKIKIVRIVIIVILVFLILFSLFLPYRTRMLIIIFSLIVYGIFLLSLFIKAVEKACMFKWMPPSKLTEGDWIAKNVKFNGRLICGPKDLGIEKKQIAKLKRLKIKKVLVKEGIPFVPSFLLGWILTLVFGNLIFMLV